MRIQLERAARGWIGRFEFLDRASGRPVIKTLFLGRSAVDGLDSALEPKLYGEEDIQLSGEHVILLRWSDCEPRTLKKTGDDDRFMKLVWAMVAEKKGPNKPPSQRGQPSVGDRSSRT